MNDGPLAGPTTLLCDTNYHPILSPPRAVHSRRARRSNSITILTTTTRRHGAPRARLFRAHQQAAHLRPRLPFQAPLRRLCTRPCVPNPRRPRARQLRQRQDQPVQYPRRRPEHEIRPQDRRCRPEACRPGSRSRRRRSPPLQGRGARPEEGRRGGQGSREESRREARDGHGMC